MSVSTTFSKSVLLSVFKLSEVSGAGVEPGPHYEASPGEDGGDKDSPGGAEKIDGEVKISSIGAGGRVIH